MDICLWNVGKLLKLNETTSPELECRVFTVRFFIRDRSSLCQRMTLFSCSSHLDVEILNHLEITPEFLDASTVNLMFSVLEILSFDQVSKMLSLSICFFAIQFGIQSDMEERCDDVTMISFLTGTT